MASRTLRVGKISSEHQIAKLLTDARLKAGLSRSEVARHLGLRSAQSLWDWENGKGSGIPAETLLKLVDLYGISAEKAYDCLVAFHQEKARQRVERNFESARKKHMGKRTQ